MSVGVLVALWVVVIFHLLAFVGEAFLWMRPTVHGRMIHGANAGIDMPVADQARVARISMINQGVYNLMVALGGLMALILAGGDPDGAQTLAFYIFAFAAVAGITLAATTTLYAGAVLQALPGLIGMVLLIL